LNPNSSGDVSRNSFFSALSARAFFRGIAIFSRDPIPPAIPRIKPSSQPLSAFKISWKSLVELRYPATGPKRGFLFFPGVAYK
jgi:hypothetical protein